MHAHNIEALVTLLGLIGYGFALVGGIMMLVAAFRTSVLWGLCCLLLPIVCLFFLFAHWSEAKSGFFVQLVGWAVVLAAVVLRAATIH
jgi:hypothetical protein